MRSSARPVIVASVTNRLKTAHELESIVGTPNPAVRMKQLDALDDGCRRVLAHAPVAGFGYRDDDGVPHTTFVGGPRGFMRVESPTRLVFDLPPERPIPSPGSGVSFVFLLPGVGETLRLNGTLAERSATRVVITVQEAFVHCARCILRSGLWQTPRTAPLAVPREGDGPLCATPVAAFLAASPFAVVSTWDAAGQSDTSPRGDEPGLLHVHDGWTLVIPDRRGNQRTDTFHNLLGCDRISIAAVVPGRDDVLHIRGTAHATDDRALLSTMALPGKVPQIPQLALIVRVEHARLAANDALRTSKLWRASARVDRAAVPDLMGLATQHLAQSKDRGVQATLLRLVGRLVGAFPGPFRRLIDFGYRKGLADEGYGASAPETRAGLGARSVRVAEVIRETADAVTLVLEDPSGAPFVFQAGQYFTLLVEIDGERIRRAYSASSLPGAPRLSLTVKRVTGGRCSSYVNEKIVSGAQLGLLGPSGSFCVQGSAPRELVLIAGGSGITPMMSIARSVLMNEPQIRVALLYGNRGEADIIFAAALNQLRAEYGERFTLRHVLQNPPPGWTGGAGLLDEATVRREVTALAPSPSARFFVCGPEPMLHGARNALLGLGISTERIHEERFSPPRTGQPGKRTVRTLPMIVEQRGRRIGAVDVPAGKTLLEAGAEQGLPLPFSCAMGNCGECKVKLMRGDVDLDEPNTLTSEERAQGFILTCVARPRSPVTIEVETEVETRIDLSGDSSS